MVDKQEGPITVEHQGDHHLTKVEYDPKTNEVAAGAILSFSKNSAASVQVKEGKAQAEFVHTGDNHSMQAGVDNKGTFNLQYKDAHGIDLDIKGDTVKIKDGEIPAAGLTIKGDHHKVSLSVDDKGKVSGVLESKVTKDSSYRVNMEGGKLINAEFVRTGKSHDLAISAGTNGAVGISYTHKNQNGASWNCSVEKKGGEVKAFGGLKLSF
jgi:hypothetical protein